MNTKTLPAIALGFSTLLGTAALARGDASWTQLRGPAQGIAKDAGVPLTWSETENVAWKTPVPGKAWSSPVIADDQVWVSNATPDGRELSVLCIDRNSGKVVHDLKLFTVAAPQFCHPFNSYASPTPVIEGDRIWVTFGSPGTVCLDRKTGKKIWERTDFVCNHFRAAGSSPMIYKDLLILPFDGSDFQYIVAMNKNTGETVWKTDRSIDFKDLDKAGKPTAQGDMRKAFSTPRLATFDGREMLISVGSKCLYAYEPASGKELWRIENRAAHSGSATPVIGDGLVYWNTGHGKAELWAVRPGGPSESGDLSESHVAWKVTKNVSTRASVLLHEGLVYMVDDGGIASCRDAKSGEEFWKERIGGNYSASPLFVDGRIYFFAEDGKTTVIEPGKTFKSLGESKLGDGFMASAAVVDGALYLRSRSALYRVEKKG